MQRTRTAINGAIYARSGHAYKRIRKLFIAERVTLARSRNQPAVRNTRDRAVSREELEGGRKSANLREGLPMLRITKPTLGDDNDRFFCLLLPFRGLSAETRTN